MTEPLLTLEEVAIALSCSKRTVYAEINRKRLKVHKIGSLTRVAPAELDRYLRARLRDLPERKSA